MNKQELIERIESLKNIFGNKCEYVKIDFMIKLVSELDEPEAGQTDEALRYVKNILARLRELPLHDREVWLKAIMGEFEQDFSHAKWREGYEQGKFEGEWVGNQLKDADKIRQELNKPVVPQFVADYIDISQFYVRTLHYALENSPEKVNLWLCENELNRQNIFARAWLDGYEVEEEEEKRYRAKVKGMNSMNGYLARNKNLGTWYFGISGNDKNHCTNHTQKELEEAGFGWVFDCEGIEIEEVE